MEATWTPTLVFVTNTATLAPTITLEPSSTPLSLVPPTRTPPATATPRAPYGASITPIDSTIIHPELGCGWCGVGGSVVDESNAPVLYMTLRLSGSIDGQPVEKLTVSGTARTTDNRDSNSSWGTSRRPHQAADSAALQPGGPAASR
jgi:hypothetical protein